MHRDDLAAGVLVARFLKAHHYTKVSLGEVLIATSLTDVQRFK